MGAPRVFVGMFGTLVVFAIATYFITGSLTTTVVETIAAAILLQIGYFVMVVFLVWKAAGTQTMKAGSDTSTGANASENKDEASIPIPALKRSPNLGP
jgi:exopolysaccharide production repressor protein